MRLTASVATAAIAMLNLAGVQPAAATPSALIFSTGDPDGKMATATRPETPGSFEIEAADDFALTHASTLTGASFTGLFVPPPGGSTGAPTDVVVEIYRVFPAGSDVSRTSFPVPPFSTAQVPARQNSPSDNALDSRDSSTHQLEFTTTDLGSFMADNSVQPSGIHAKPDQTTTGNGEVTGEEVRFDVSFTNPFSLDPGHYFFVPQVALDSSNNFLWLSAPRPILAPPDGTGTPFPAGFTDLQSWTRDAMLDPDWLRVGTDIVGAGTFNAVFSLTGVVPEPGTLTVLGSGLLGLVLLRRSKSRG